VCGNILGLDIRVKIKFKYREQESSQITDKELTMSEFLKHIFKEVCK